MNTLIERLRTTYINWKVARALGAAMTGASEGMQLGRVEHDFDPGRAVEATPAPGEVPEVKPDPTELVLEEWVLDPRWDDRRPAVMCMDIAPHRYATTDVPVIETLPDGSFALTMPK